MNHKQILEKAIQKAIAGGWNPFISGIKSVDYHQGKIERNLLITVQAVYGDMTIMYNLEAFIFSHDFAKALWGKKPMRIFLEHDRDSNKVKNDEGLYLENYAYHLAMMVISDDPIKYLGENP